MTLGNFMRLTEAALRPQVEGPEIGNRGELSMASSADDRLQLLSTAPGRWRLVMMFDGSEKVGRGKGGGSRMLHECFFAVVLQQSTMERRRGAIGEHDSNLPVLDRADLLQRVLEGIQYLAEEQFPIRAEALEASARSALDYFKSVEAPTKLLLKLSDFARSIDSDD